MNNAEYAAQEILSDLALAAITGRPSLESVVKRGNSWLRLYGECIPEIVVLEIYEDEI